MAEETVLIVDDDPAGLQLVTIVLERQGFCVSQCDSGEMALEYAKTHSPSLIMLDVMMPKMDGYEVARRLRADPQTAHIPIIMFTSRAMLNDEMNGFESGVDDYLTKPIHPTEMVERIKSVLERTAARHDGRSGT